MKILLTGKPGIGKSTALRMTKELYTGELGGVYTEEIRNEKHERVGFRASNMQHESRICAHKELFQDSPYKIGSFYVDLECINSFIVPALTPSCKINLLLIDEIGRMQVLSIDFLDRVKNVFNTDQDILATIVLDPEPWSLEFKESPQAVVVEVTKENRDALPELLNIIFKQDTDFLNESQKIALNRMVKNYFENDSFIQIKKLFKNALPYLESNKVLLTKAKTFEVQGNHDVHTVTLSPISCDCDLFNGRNTYEKKSGICSHIQAAELFKLR